MSDQYSNAIKDPVSDQKIETSKSSQSNVNKGNLFEQIFVHKVNEVSKDDKINDKKLDQQNDGQKNLEIFVNDLFSGKKK